MKLLIDSAEVAGGAYELYSDDGEDDVGEDDSKAASFHFEFVRRALGHADGIEVSEGEKVSSHLPRVE